MRKTFWLFLVLLLAYSIPAHAGFELGGGSGAGGGGAIETQDEDLTVNAVTSVLNFAGAGVNCADAGGGKTTCTIPGGGGGNDYKALTLVTDTVTPTPLTETESGNLVASFATPVTATLPNAPTNGTWYTLVAGNGTVFTINSTQPMVHPPGSDLGGLTTTVLANGQSVTAVYFAAGPLWILFLESHATTWNVAAGPYQMGELVHPETSPPFTWYQARRAVPIGTDPTDIGNSQYWVRIESPFYVSDTPTPEVLAATPSTIVVASRVQSGQEFGGFTFTPSVAPGAANDTNYVSISLDFYPAAGGASTNLSVMDSTTTGQIGGATAFVPIFFVTGGNFLAAADGTLGLTITQTGTGLLLPSGAFSVIVNGQGKP